MQTVKISKDNFDSFEKDTLLTLEQAEWYTQNEGFIPLPRKSNKENIKVIFSKLSYEQFYICLKKLKINKWRVSKIVDNEGRKIGYMLAIHTIPSKAKNEFYISFPEPSNYHFFKDSWLSYIKDDINQNKIKCIKEI